MLDWLQFLTGQRIVKRLRTSMFSSILKQETAFFDKTRTGELINRLSSDTALLGRSVTENLSDGLRAGAQASVGVGMMVWWSLPCLSFLVVSVCFSSVRLCANDSVQKLLCVLGYKCVSLVTYSNFHVLHCNRWCACSHLMFTHKPKYGQWRFDMNYSCCPNLSSKI